MNQTRHRRPAHRPGVTFQPDLLTGIDAIANLVRGTLGPLARTVAVEGNSRTEVPEILDDAGILARRVVQIGDPVHDAGAMLLRHALWRVRELHGDGAATAAMIAQTMAHQAARAVAAGVHASVLRDALTRAADDAITALRARSTRIGGGSAGREMLNAVAKAMCPDVELRDSLTQAVDIVGAEGGIKIVPNEPRTILSEFIEGAMWEAGWLAPGFSSEPGKALVRMNDACVVVLAGTLNSPDAVLRGLTRLMEAGHSRVMILAEGLGEEAKLLLVQIQHQGVLQLLPVKTPFVDNNAQLALQDMCVLTGATLLNSGMPSADEAFARIDPAHAGSARRVWADEKRAGIVGGARDSVALRASIALIRRQIASETKTEELEVLRSRLGRLNGGLAMIRVGAVTVRAGGARRDQAERMARALQSALASGVVAGGGATLVRVAAELEAREQPTFEARWARDIVAQSLRAPLKVIAENAGYDHTVPIHTMTRGAADAVFDVRTGADSDMRAAGVIDPVETLCSGIRVAASMTAMAITTDALVLRKSPPTGAQP